MAVVMLAAEDVHVNKSYGFFVAFAMLGFDMIFVFISYILIFQAVFCLPQKESQIKAFNTCIAHVVVFLEFYIFVFFSIF
jgi:olfactory receptor